MNNLTQEIFELLKNQILTYSEKKFKRRQSKSSKQILKNNVLNCIYIYIKMKKLQSKLSNSCI